MRRFADGARQRVTVAYAGTLCRDEKECGDNKPQVAVGLLYKEGLVGSRFSETLHVVDLRIEPQTVYTSSFYLFFQSLTDFFIVDFVDSSDVNAVFI